MTASCKSVPVENNSDSSESIDVSESKSEIIAESESMGDEIENSITEDGKLIKDTTYYAVEQFKPIVVLSVNTEWPQTIDGVKADEIFDGLIYANQ